MKKRFFQSTYLIATVLVILAVGFYILQQILFHEPRESGFLFFQDLAFLPLHVLLVSLILDRILNAREKRERLEQMNIVVSAFYSELGSDALRVLNPFMKEKESMYAILGGMETWGKDRFGQAAESIMERHLEADSRAGDLNTVRRLLTGKRESMLVMFENPNLLENSRFTGMLWALYHLQDELANREEIGSLPETDLNHLSGDIVRAYKLLVVEWIYYMRHLQEKYPYLFSLAIRTSPFEKEKTVVIY